MPKEGGGEKEISEKEAKTRETVEVGSTGFESRKAPSVLKIEKIGHLPLNCIGEQLDFE